MNCRALILLLVLPAWSAHAQLKTGSLGGSGLNRRPATPSAPVLPGLPIPQAAPGAPAQPARSAQPTMPPPSNSVAAKGILLEAGWDKRVTGPARAANGDMADLRACH